ncbi:hypothetical protein [Myceligenerans xiligouense]|nr:hypothetical protein [Myceligenerans xiligouense]
MSTTTPPNESDPVDRPPERTVTAGTLRIELWYLGREPEPWPDRGARHRYSYRVTDTATRSRDEGDERTREEVSVAVGSDLRSGVGAPVDPDETMCSLVAFLSAAGEAYAWTMRNPSTPSENLGLFPDWLNEAAYMNLSELAVLEASLNPDLGPDDDELEAAFLAAAETPGSPASWPPATWYDIVFLQDDEGHQIVDLIDTQGVEAATERLAAYDYGTETRDTALFHGHYYDEPPGSVDGHSIEDGDYVLTWNAGLGHVNLLRRFDPTDEPPAFWPDRTARLAPHTPTGLPEEPPNRHPSATRRSHSPGL